MSHLFKTRSLRAMHVVFTRHAHHMRDVLDDAARNGTVVDMQRLFAAYTLGSGLESFFGVEVEEEIRAEFEKHFDAAQHAG